MSQTSLTWNNGYKIFMRYFSSLTTLSMTFHISQMLESLREFEKD